MTHDREALAEQLFDAAQKRTLEMYPDHGKSSWNEPGPAGEVWRAIWRAVADEAIARLRDQDVNIEAPVVFVDDVGGGP